MSDPTSITPAVATIHFDGGVVPALVASAQIRYSDGTVDEISERLDEGTHNVAEYRALMLGARRALARGVRRVAIKGDSRLIVEQVNGECKTRAPHLLELRDQAHALLSGFEEWSLGWVPREENAEADALGRTRTGD